MWKLTTLGENPPLHVTEQGAKEHSVSQIYTGVPRCAGGGEGPGQAVGQPEAPGQPVQVNPKCSLQPSLPGHHGVNPGEAPPEQ